MDNLDFWNSVEKTDTAFTKFVNQRGGYTNIDAYYLIKKATSKFGLYGKGFGLSESHIDTCLIESTGIALHKAVFFYVVDGEKHSFPINNAIQANNGKYFDADFAKKVETNTLGKALSKIGFSADVYLGKFEDQEYLHDLNQELKVEKAANKDEERARQAVALTDDCMKVIEQIESSGNLSVVEGLYKAMARRLKDKDKSLMIKLTKAKDAAKERLNETA